MLRPLLALLLWCAGCVPGLELQHFPRLLDWPARQNALDDGVWLKLTTPDFELDTNLPYDEAQYAAETCTRETFAIRAVMGSSPPPLKQPVRIIAIANTVDFDSKFDRRIVAMSLRMGGEQVLFLSGKPDRWEHRASLVDGAPATVTHEMAHVVLAQYFFAQPRWFAEGMAEYLASYKWSNDGRQVELGIANLDAYRTYRAFRSVGLHDVLTWDNAVGSTRQAVEAARYGYAWAFIHYLINREPQTFQSVMESISHGAEGVARVNDSLAPKASDYDERVFQYMKTGDYRTVVLPVALARQNAVVEPLGAADEQHVHELIDAAARAYHGEK